jgi:hypothetical protein
MTPTTAFFLGLTIGALAATIVCIILAYLWSLHARRKVAALKQDILLRAHANDAYEKALRTGKHEKGIPTTPHAR